MSKGLTQHQQIIALLTARGATGVNNYEFPQHLSIYSGKYTKIPFAIVDAEDFEWLRKIKWHAIKTGYLQTMVRDGKKQTTTYMHIEILKRHKLYQKGSETDHINGDKLDNRKSNLRVVNHQQNQSNRTRQKNNTSGFTGIRFKYPQKRWQAEIQFNGKNIYLGTFDTKKEAMTARLQGEDKYFGEFSRRLNGYPE
jgi:hypothetical protein